ncbi:hypothetical protein Efla_002629 [Eimeria flavescens]
MLSSALVWECISFSFPSSSSSPSCSSSSSSSPCSSSSESRSSRVMPRRGRHLFVALAGLLLGSFSLFPCEVEGAQPIGAAVDLQSGLLDHRAESEAIPLHPEKEALAFGGAALGDKDIAKANADLLLLEHDLGGDFVNELVRMQNKANKSVSRFLGALGMFILCVALMEVIIRFYIVPISPHVHQVYRQRFPGRPPLDKELVPYVALFSSPLIAMLAAVVFVTATVSVFRMLMAILSFDFAKMDLEYARDLEQEMAMAEEEGREQ